MIDARLDRICIVMMSAVGDSVHVLPVVNALRRAAPKCHITWILQPAPASLVKGHAAVDEILLFGAEKGWRDFASIRERLRERSFDLVLDLQVYLKASVVTSFIRAPVKLGFDRARARDMNWMFTTHRIPPHAPQHVQDQYFEFLTALGVQHEPVEWRLGSSDEERAWQREFYSTIGGPAVALNIATSNPDRDWLPERWAEVIDLLHERHGLRAVLVGGRSERELSIEQAIRASARHQPVSALGSGFRPLVSILEGAELAIALDSAPLHIAVAVDTPVISLMANADPRRTGPYRRFHDLIVDAYHDPGEKAPISMERRWGRMPRISVDDVAERLERWERCYRGR